MIDILLKLCARNATRIMAGALLLGLLLPPLAAALRPVLPMVVWVVLYFSMLRIDWREIAAFRSRPVLVAASVAFVLLASPYLIWAATATPGLDLGAGLTTGLVMMGASSPYTAVAAVAIILGLDGALALVILVLTTLLMPLVLPLLVVDVMGFDVALDASGLMQRLALLVGLAMVLAIITKGVLGQQRLARYSFRIDGLIVAMLVLFAVALMDGITAQFLAQPGRIGLILIGAFAANLLLTTAGALIFWRSGARLALTIGYAAGNGNMAILLAVLPLDAPVDIALYFALGQFPMYILPMLLKPVFQRILAARPEGG